MAAMQSVSLLKYDSPNSIRSKVQLPEFGFSDRQLQKTEDELGQRDEDVLSAMLPPKRFEENGELWIQSVSKTPATRHDVVQLREQLDRELGRRRARETGICPIREELYWQCFDELIRQVTVNCVERGLLLLNVRDEMKMTIDAYRTLFESGIAFGLRKMISSEEKKTEGEQRIVELESENVDLRSQILELKNACMAIERRETECRDQQIRKHQEEVEYLENYAQQLKQQLEALTVQS